MNYKKNCIICETEFECQRQNSKYCSDLCKKQGARRNRMKRLARKHKEISHRHERYKRKLIKKATPTELMVKSIFDDIGVNYRFQKGCWKLKGKTAGYHIIVDFYIPSLKVAVELDGKYHDERGQRKRDRFKDDWLRRERGIWVLRIANKNAGKVVGRITEFVKSNKIKNCHRDYWYGCAEKWKT